MTELDNLIALQEMRCEQFIIHVRENMNATQAERVHLLALLEDLVKLKAERQRREDLASIGQAA